MSGLIKRINEANRDEAVGALGVVRVRMKSEKSNLNHSLVCVDILYKKSYNEASTLGKCAKLANV